MIDFVVPALVLVLARERGRGWLRSATRWLLAHNRVISIVVLLAFGVLFVCRGLAQIAAVVATDVHNLHGTRTDLDALAIPPGATVCLDCSQSAGRLPLRLAESRAERVE